MSARPRPSSRAARVRCALGWLAAVAILVPAALAPSRPWAKERKQVLVLHSYHKGLRWTDAEDAGISAVLGTRPEVEVHTEYMDTKRHPDDAHQRNLLALYRTKFPDSRFAAVLATDDAAYELAVENRETLFPRAAIVFCGVNHYTDPGDDRLRDVVTGVVESIDIPSTLRAALSLQGDVRRVVVINDRTVTGLANRKILDEGTSEFSSRIRFEYLEDLDFSEVLAAVRSLSRGDIILLLTFNRDRSGSVIDYQEAVTEIARVAPVPIYGVWDFYLGSGIVGGMLTSGVEQGRTAAAMVLRILDGAPVRSVPVERRSPNRFMFDVRQLQRFGLSRADLPGGSAFVNEPPSFYELNKTLVRGVLAACIALSAIAALLWLNATQRRREAQSQRFLASVSAALAESLDLDAAGSAVARMAVPRLADGALLCVDDGSGEPRAWLAHADPAGGSTSVPVPATAVSAIASRPGVAAAIRAVSPIVSRSDIAEGWPERLVDGGDVATESTFPLVAGGRILGALSLAWARRRPSGRDLALAGELAHRAATALLNASLFRRAENAVHARDEFLAIASHELKTPLTPLRLRIQALQRLISRGASSRVSRERLDHALDGADEQIQRLVGLVDDLLHMSRIKHEVQLDIGPTDLGATVEDAIDRLRDRLASSGCSLSTRIARGVVGRWDRARIEEVCVGLLTNAMKYAPGPVEIVVEDAGPAARLVVRDQGVGIAPADRDRIFLPFERAASCMRSTGFGLGLYVARRIAAAHGGVVRLESGPGAGSSFVLELPRAGPTAPVAVTAGTGVSG